MKEKNEFPPSGLTYFWCLNDYCDDEAIDAQIESFAKAGIERVCLHPRDGLLLPYGSSDWFDFIRSTVLKLKSKNIGAWLYDEDPFPSGNAGGKITLEHPEFIARKIEMHTASADEVAKDGTWYFPANGGLLFCGFFSAETGKLISDETSRIGLIRRTWKTLKNWDSRWYYPATPLYVSDRAMANVPEYAVRAGKVPEGQILAAFIIEAIPNDKWNFHADPLNPHATAKFIEYTHEKYFSTVGGMFGKEIGAIFTDESKYYGLTPWTPGMIEDFGRTYGYDLKPKLIHLFTNFNTPESMRAKVDYREWCGKRFEDAWVKPVSEWCGKHNLKLVGHMSPEEDPVSQSQTLSNLMPLQKHLSLAGFDLIIPAVGDKEHPILNVGIISAVSSAQQHGLPGVMSESLACSGTDFTIEKARRIFNWQTVMGMTTPVVHGIFHTLRNERELECPPDFGPDSKFSPGLAKLSDDLKPIQQMLRGAVQSAPVAILWPIKSFYVQNIFWIHEQGGLREELTGLMLKCLEAHVGIQLLDEADLCNAKLESGLLKIGNAAYSDIIIPGSTIWGRSTVEMLEECLAAGLGIHRHGTMPEYMHSSSGVGKKSFAGFKPLTDAMIAETLPKLIELKSAAPADIRVSKWTRDGRKFFLLCSLGSDITEAQIEGKTYKLSSQTITMIE